MKFIILAYNPEMIDSTKLDDICNKISTDQGCPIYLISHLDKNAEPIYCVQLADTEKEV